MANPSLPSRREVTGASCGGGNAAGGACPEACEGRRMLDLYVDGARSDLGAIVSVLLPHRVKRLGHAPLDGRVVDRAVDG
jgi:hypothetical protein